MRAVLLALAFVAVAVVPASASTILSYTGSGPFGAPDLSDRVNIQSPEFNEGRAGGVLAGQFRMTDDAPDGLGDFLAFCVDLAQTLKPGQSYSVEALPFSTAAVANLDRLFTGFYTGVTDRLSAAAFQVAIWEIITDSDTVLDLASGGFTAANRHGASGDVIASATALLNGLSGAGAGGYQITFLRSATSQDLITVSPVPLPGAAGLLAASVLAFGAIRRRRACPDEGCANSRFTARRPAFWAERTRATPALGT